MVQGKAKHFAFEVNHCWVCLLLCNVFDHLAAMLQPSVFVCISVPPCGMRGAFVDATSVCVPFPVHIACIIMSA